MKPESAGLLLYRPGPDHAWEVLLVKPSGPAARWGWSLPKGLIENGEPPLSAARRELHEEAGVEYTGEAVPLGHVDYVKSRKRVHGFAGPAPPTATPRAASWEVSAARFVPLLEAERLLHVDQRVFVERLRAILAPAPGRES